MKESVNLVELTVPHQDNMDNARARKIDCCVNFIKKCEDAGRKAEDLPIEVGCRGFFGHIVRRPLLSLKLTHRKVNTTLSNIQTTVEEANHWIWLKREGE